MTHLVPASRIGQALNAALQREILDIAWRLEELLHWFDAADPILAAVIARPLTRTALGLSPLGDSPPTPLDADQDE